MTLEELKNIGDHACVSVAAGHDAYWQNSEYLEPRLWEALRVELQRRYRRSTGESMAVLLVEPATKDSPTSQMMGIPDEPTRHYLDRSQEKFGECHHCGERKSLGKDHDGDLICGGCADANYLAEWIEYGRSLRTALAAKDSPNSRMGGLEKPIAWRWRDNQYQTWNFVDAEPVHMDYVFVEPLYAHPNLIGVEDEIERVVQSVNEWDDRTSPDDYPEHLLITSGELADILRNFADALGGSPK